MLLAGEPFGFLWGNYLIVGLLVLFRQSFCLQGSLLLGRCFDLNSG